MSRFPKMDFDSMKNLLESEMDREIARFEEMKSEFASFASTNGFAEALRWRGDRLIHAEVSATAAQAVKDSMARSNLGLLAALEAVSGLARKAYDQGFSFMGLRTEADGCHLMEMGAAREVRQALRGVLSTGLLNPKTIERLRQMAEEKSKES